MRYKQIEVIRCDPSYGQYSMMEHKQEFPNEERLNLLQKAIQRMQTDGLNSLKYNEKKISDLPLYTHIEVEV